MRKQAKFRALLIGFKLCKLYLRSNISLSKLYNILLE